MKFLIGLTLFLLPTYTVRFNLSGLPLNLLMVWVAFLVLVFVAWLIKNNLLKEYFAWVRSLNKLVLIFASLFFIAGTVSLFVGGFTLEKFGQYIVLFIEPIALFKIFGFVFHKHPDTKELFVRSLYIFLGFSGIYALIQYVTLFGLPPEYLGNAVEPKRALSFFEYPNAYAMFIAPCLAYLLPQVIAHVTKINKSNWRALAYPIICYSLGILGLTLSLSRGGWLAFAVTSVVAVFLLGNKKIKTIFITGALVAAIIVAIVPNFRYRIILPFKGEKSAVSRLSLWHTANKMIKEEPITGLGLLGFNNNFEKYNTDPGLSHYKYPHNLELSLWVDTGLLGLVSFILLVLALIYNCLTSIRKPLKLSLILFLLAILIHGVIDVPYFKNDLSSLFWLMIALSI